MCAFFQMLFTKRALARHGHNMMTPQNHAKKLSWPCITKGVSSDNFLFSWYFFYLRNRVIRPFVGAVRLHSLSSHNNFFLKFYGHGIISGFSEMPWPWASI